MRKVQNYTALAQTIECDGFAIVPDVVDGPAVEALCDTIATAADDRIVRRGRVYAIRNLLTAVPEMLALARSDVLRELVEPVLGAAAQVVRGLLFDKRPEANWHVGWHQDLVIPVDQRVDVAGFEPWSVKAGVPHVKPPVNVLEAMLTLRILLDDCGPDDGPLRVIPGSHVQGELTQGEIRRFDAKGDSVACTGQRSDVVVLRPLLLHASSPATAPHHRRVVHLEYAGAPLSSGLAWPVIG